MSCFNKKKKSGSGKCNSAVFFLGQTDAKHSQESTFKCMHCLHRFFSISSSQTSAGKI